MVMIKTCPIFVSVKVFFIPDIISGAGVGDMAFSLRFRRYVIQPWWLGVCVFCSLCAWAFYEPGSGCHSLAVLDDTFSFVLDNPFEILDTPSPACQPWPNLLLIDYICSFSCFVLVPREYFLPSS